jgi:hypothetical protein
MADTLLRVRHHRAFMASPNESDDEMTEAPDGFCRLGSFDVFEAERLLKQFEESGIRFQINKVEGQVFTSGGLTRGTGYSKTTLIEIFVHKDDEQKATKILTADWKV